MPSEEKQPYIKASMNIKNKKQNHQKIENIKKSDINTEKIKKKNAQKQEPIKKPRKKRAPKKTPKKKNTTESDSDSYTSDTAGTNTSEDLSDVSS
ncbi:hypothetical protein WH47_07831 [Habropoda laboriosa]|uniref:Uncharacterized protein n=1 Tax=Habropoda laboriosa TaxID=597456 RepID=A0A0L7QPB0_9HYME|nr:hypothetical protein WH47_07831 [Habropoda laboriosa]